MQQITPITVEQLADILAAANIINTIDHSGMLAHEINHPTIGNAITVQGANDALLIRGL